MKEERCVWYNHMIHQGSTSKNSKEYDLLLKNKKFNNCMECQGTQKKCDNYASPSSLGFYKRTKKMKNKILTSIIAGSFLLSGCSRFIKKESVVIPEGYSPIFVQTLKYLRNEEDYVIGKAYATSENLEDKRGTAYDMWGEKVVKSFSSEEYQTNCLEHAREKAFQDILEKTRLDPKTKRSRFVLIDILTASSEEGKKCYSEVAIGREYISTIKKENKK